MDSVRRAGSALLFSPLGSRRRLAVVVVASRFLPSPCLALHRSVFFSVVYFDFGLA